MAKSKEEQAMISTVYERASAELRAAFHAGFTNDREKWRDHLRNVMSFCQNGIKASEEYDDLAR